MQLLFDGRIYANLTFLFYYHNSWKTETAIPGNCQPGQNDVWQVILANKD